jgi:ADP-ribose pyrophosphatase YjhB (NUDIX family)
LPVTAQPPPARVPASGTRQGPRSRLRVVAYRTFYKLPGVLRRGIVRTLTPTFTLGALILVRDADALGQGRLLMVRQPRATGWSLPGGLLNRNERIRECAARELREETGIEVAPTDLRPAIPNAVVHTDGRWVDMVFEVDVSADRELVLDPAEVVAAAWHPIDHLPEMTVNTARLLAHYDLGPYAEYPEVKEL